MYRLSNKFLWWYAMKMHFDAALAYESVITEKLYDNAGLFAVISNAIIVTGVVF